MKITFCGAAGTVTGSSHLVEANGLRVLLDCGLFQGSREIDERNRSPFPFDPASLDFVLLSHAHLDHAGLLPRLVHDGFTGRILCTPPTAAIAKLMLADSAHLQVEEAAYRTRKAKRRGEAGTPPLYDMDDVLRTADLFQPIPGYGDLVDLGKGLSCVFHDAGHILGSACIELRTSNGRLLFSGDLGNRHQPIVRDPSTPPHVDVVLVESTYGDRVHRSIEDSIAELRDAIHDVIPGGGNVLVPSFALERAQEVLYELFLLWTRHDLPQCRIYLDSPLATSTTRVFERFPDYFDDEGRKVFSQRPNPFDFPLLHYAQTTDESKQINAQPGGNVIIAGSGMCTGGRILHHLRYNLWNAAAGVVFVGYQAVGTLGRNLVEGTKSVHLFGEEVAVRAKVWTVNGFSSHADQPILMDWIGKAKPRDLFLVHGESASQKALQSKIQSDLGIVPRIPAWKETVTV
ncbi:MAG: MBL fold metallo-hydrolase [Candidatus Bipolaricaulota bacterium]|nr:MBL fold metallo-hydrolase [Candidatus Bipolaricaulota bacterium]